MLRVEKICSASSDNYSENYRHLASKEAYRRDRRKDLLLQERGYIVLRFLASDVSKQLDVVLDSILRVLIGRQSI